MGKSKKSKTKKFFSRLFPCASRGANKDEDKYAPIDRNRDKRNYRKPSEEAEEQGLRRYAKRGPVNDDEREYPTKLEAEPKRILRDDDREKRRSRSEDEHVVVESEINVTKASNLFSEYKISPSHSRQRETTVTEVAIEDTDVRDGGIACDFENDPTIPFVDDDNVTEKTSGKRLSDNTGTSGKKTGGTESISQNISSMDIDTSADNFQPEIHSELQSLLVNTAEAETPSPKQDFDQVNTPEFVPQEVLEHSDVSHTKPTEDINMSLEMQNDISAIESEVNIEENRNEKSDVESAEHDDEVNDSDDSFYDAKDDQIQKDSGDERYAGKVNEKNVTTSITIETLTIERRSPNDVSETGVNNCVEDSATFDGDEKGSDPDDSETEREKEPEELLPPFNDNILFFQNKIISRPSLGYRIEEMHKWKGDYHMLEMNHSYIQWLFPMSEGSGMNYQAQALREHEAEVIKNTPELKKRLLTSFEMMLDFYGMEYVNGRIRRNENWQARYNHLNSSFHNRMRITRIIKCLGELGYEELQATWLSFLMKEALVTRELYKLGGDSMMYFIDAIKSDEEKHKFYEKYFRYSQDNCSEEDTSEEDSDKQQDYDDKYENDNQMNQKSNPYDTRMHDANQYHNKPQDRDGESGNESQENNVFVDSCDEVDDNNAERYTSSDNDNYDDDCRSESDELHAGDDRVVYECNKNGANEVCDSYQNIVELKEEVDKVNFDKQTDDRKNNGTIDDNEVNDGVGEDDNDNQENNDFEDNDDPMRLDEEENQNNDEYKNRANEVCNRNQNILGLKERDNQVNIGKQTDDWKDCVSIDDNEIKDRVGKDDNDSQENNNFEDNDNLVRHEEEENQSDAYTNGANKICKSNQNMVELKEVDNKVNFDKQTDRSIYGNEVKDEVGEGDDDIHENTYPADQENKVEDDDPVRNDDDCHDDSCSQQSYEVNLEDTRGDYGSHDIYEVKGGIDDDDDEQVRVKNVDGNNGVDEGNQKSDELINVDNVINNNDEQGSHTNKIPDDQAEDDDHASDVDGDHESEGYKTAEEDSQDYRQASSTHSQDNSFSDYGFFNPDTCRNKFDSNFTEGDDNTEEVTASEVKEKDLENSSVIGSYSESNCFVANINTEAEVEGLADDGRGNIALPSGTSGEIIFDRGTSSV